MIETLDIIEALIKAIKQCVPHATHYMNLPEGYQTPSFLYCPVFRNDTKETPYLKSVKVDLQIVLLTKMDSDGKCDKVSAMELAAKLSPFLDTFRLNVKSRTLLFNYELNSIENALTLDMTFRFKEALQKESDNEEIITEIKWH
jgi:hypothetical protein